MTWTNPRCIIIVAAVFFALLAMVFLPSLVWGGEESFDVSEDTAERSERFLSSTPNLSIEKTSAPNPVSAGGVLTYTITTVNNGDTDATSVIITDAIPENTIYITESMTYTFVSGVAVTQTQPISITSGNVMTWEVSSLGTSYPTNTITTTFQVTVTSPLTNGTIITNTANVTCEEGVSDTYTITTTVVSTPTLHIVKRDEPSEFVEAGGHLTYTISISNTGNGNATLVKITETLPINTNFITTTGDYTSYEPSTPSAGQVITWEMGSLIGEGEERKVVTLVVTVTTPLTDGTIITNTANVTCEEGVSDTYTITTTVRSTPILRISKKANRDVMLSGTELVYTISYENTGNMVATGVVITDILAGANVRFDGYSLPPSGETDNTIYWEIPSLGIEGQTILVTVTANVLSPTTITTITNTVILDSEQTDEQRASVATRVTPVKVYLPAILRGYPPTWKQGRGLEGITVRSFGICADCQAIYAGTWYRGVYKSTDGGENWSPKGLGGHLVFGLVVDPTDCKTVYATTWGEGIFKTTDGGENWFQVNNGLEGNLWLYALAIAPNGTTLYAGTATGGVYKTTDGSGKWVAVNSGLTELDIRSLAIDPLNTEVVYAGTVNGVYKTENGGGSWGLKGLEGKKIWSFAIDPSNTEVVYAGTAGYGVYKTTDGGGSWEEVGLGGSSVYALVIDKVTTFIYAGIKKGGVYKSTNKGDSWEEMNIGLDNLDVRKLAIGCNRLHAGTKNGAWWYPLR